MTGLPLATYRLQLTAAFGFERAAAVVPYLKSLGITHLYASPFLKARSGSSHGYDIIDHAELNPELGGEAGFERLSAALKASGLGLILDFVPNHMGVHFADNAWWLDVLEWGPASPYAAYFDIDWETLPFRRRPGLLLPILGSSYGAALDEGEIELRYDADEGSLSAWYFEHRLPISPLRYREILQTTLQLGDINEVAHRRLTEIVKTPAFQRPGREDAHKLKAALREVDGAEEVIGHGLSAFRAGPGRAVQTLALHHLLERQHYRLADWRLATSEINYRRFFDVNTLAGLRVENQATFEAIHGKVARLIAEDKLQGLRLDHIDGLRDPAGYCQRLQRLIRSVQPDPSRPFYVVVEKILGERETLPRFRGIHGTTGYDILNVITQLLVRQDGLDALDEIWRQAADSSPAFEPVLIDAKRRVLTTILTSEFTVLVRLLARIAAGHYATRDYSADALRQALELYIVHFPVYRTYIAGSDITAHDRQLIESAIDRARSQWGRPDAGIFKFLRDALTLDLIAAGASTHGKPRVRRFAYKMQQFTGPMMAKSLEDTAFYRYHRMLALNEVGGSPAAGEIDLPRFHAMMTARAKNWPSTMTATATHDTKRGEDARVRIASLSEIAHEWGAAVGTWKRLNARHVTRFHNIRAPSLADEYMIYQTLIGAYPSGAIDDDFVKRVCAFVLKASREAKLETSWISPDETYERHLQTFVSAILDTSAASEFLSSLASLARRTSLLGLLNALTQLTLKATLPGIPDFYQGTEFWNLSMVDPDNRRPVDFAIRQEVLRRTEKIPHDWNEMVARSDTNELKLRWTHHLLKFRQAHADIFGSGTYQPLEVSGRDRDNIVSFARVLKSRAAIVITVRHFASLTDGGRRWPDLASMDAKIDLQRYAPASPLVARQGQLAVRDILETLPVRIIAAERR